MSTAGISDLETAIDRLLRRGPSILDLQRALGDLEIICLGVENRLKHDEAVLGDAIRLARREQTQKQTNVRQRLAQIEQKQEQIKLTLDDLDDVGHTFARDLVVVKDVTIERLRAALDDVLSTFAEQEVEAFRKADLASKISGIWYCDTRPLRRKLETAFLDAYRFGANDLLEIERGVCGKLEEVFNQLQADQEITLKVGRPTMMDPAPSIGALGQTVAFDLSSQWERWWQRWRTTHTRMKQFKDLVFSEFEPIVDALLKTAACELDRQRQASARRFDDIAQEMSGLLDKQRGRLQRLNRRLAGEGSSLSTTALVDQYEANRQSLANDLLRYRNIDAALRRLIDDCTSLTASGGPANIAN